MHRPGPGNRRGHRTAIDDDPKQVVAAGYDAIADRFAAWQRQITGSSRLNRLEDLLSWLPTHPDVLEFGCGAGVRSTRVLAKRARLIGVDISAEQVRRARDRVPDATFVHGDVCEVEFAPASFDAVVAFYVLNHVPREELAPLLRRVASWLRPNGYLLATFGASDNPGWRGEWLGTEMFFSCWEPAETLELVQRTGLQVVEEELETIREPEGDATFLWLLAQRPA